MGTALTAKYIRSEGVTIPSELSHGCRILPKLLSELITSERQQEDSPASTVLTTRGKAGELMLSYHFGLEAPLAGRHHWETSSSRLFKHSPILSILYCYFPYSTTI